MCACSPSSCYYARCFLTSAHCKNSFLAILFIILFLLLSTFKLKCESYSSVYAFLCVSIFSFQQQRQNYRKSIQSGKKQRALKKHVINRPRQNSTCASKKSNRFVYSYSIIKYIRRVVVLLLLLLSFSSFQQRFYNEVIII